jgi:Cof subfamily protein (haloacid dehalogenase superfamily)
VYVHIGGANSHDKPLFRLRHFALFPRKSVQKHRLHSAHSAQTQNGALLPRAVSNSILAPRRFFKRSNLFGSGGRYAAALPFSAFPVSALRFSTDSFKIDAIAQTQSCHFAQPGINLSGGLMGAYDGLYLYCDLDGTLLDDQKRVSAANRAAIRSFVEQGGRFGVATGRVPLIIGAVESGLPVNAPCILFNGAGLYDLEKKEYLAMHPIDSERTAHVISRAVALVGDSCPQIFNATDIYELNPRQRDDPQTIIERMPTIHAPIDQVPRPFLKFLLAHVKESLDFLEQTLSREGAFEGLSAFRSSDVYLEFVAPGVNKGSALEDVRRRCDHVRKILAIGDFNNDLEMVTLADVGGAPANAIPAVKAAADIVLPVDNNHDCVARFLHEALGLQQTGEA